jgi:hypothetical protein
MLCLIFKDHFFISCCFFKQLLYNIILYRTCQYNLFRHVSCDFYIISSQLKKVNGNKKRAAVELNCTVRHINRMIKGYKETGKKFFVHGNRGRKPHILILKKPLMLTTTFFIKY